MSHRRRRRDGRDDGIKFSSVLLRESEELGEVFRLVSPFFELDGPELGHVCGGDGGVEEVVEVGD